MIDIPLLMIQIVSLGVDVLWCMSCVRLLTVSGKSALERSLKNLAIGAIITATGIALFTVSNLAPIPRNTQALGAISTAAGGAFMVVALRQQRSIWDVLSSQDSKRVLEAFAITNPDPKTGTAKSHERQPNAMAGAEHNDGDDVSMMFNGQRVLIEFDPASDYDDFVVRRVKDLLSAGSTLTLFTKQGSVFSRMKGVKLVLLSFSEQSIKLDTGGNLSVSITNPSLILDTFTSILRSNPEETVIVDNLTDLAINLGFERTYNLLQGMGEIVADTKSNLLLLFNPKAHDEKIAATFEGYCNVILRYDRTGLHTEKGVVNLAMYAEE